VLNGAGKVLKDTEVVILEVSFFKTMTTNPEIYDVAAYMKKRGFLTYDIFLFIYGPLDGALSQIDMVFVKENGFFRQSHAFASPKQRERLTQSQKASLDKKMR
jgi:hypothetical protein